MARNNSNKNPARNLICNKCLASAHAIPNTPHRRCSGNSENNTPRDKGNYIPGVERGKWN